METMSLTGIPVNVSVKDVPDKNGALVNVEGIANIKVMSTDDLLPLAIERFLGKTPEEIKQTCFMTLEGNLRGVIGTLTIEELLREREKFQQAVMNEAGLDLNKMGIGVDTFKIQSITDSRNYIASLGKKQTADVVRNATIGEAEAKRDADKQSAEARQIGETAQAAAAKAISDANRERDVAIADNEALVTARKAMIPIAGKIAEAERTRELNVATIGAQKAQVTAEIELQTETGKRNAAEYAATIVVKADKEREALVIAADAKQKAAVLEGEAVRVTAEKTGQGEQAKMTAEALGRIEQAKAVQKELEAKAAGTLAQLLAEAEGILKKAEAYKQLDQGGRFLLILQSLPPVIEAIGNALEKVATPVAKAIGEGLGNIDEVKIIDMGGNNVGGRNLLSQFGNTPVEMMFGLWQKVQALGLEPAVRALADKAGINVDEALKAVVDSATTAAPAGAGAGAAPVKPVVARAE